MPFNQRRYRPLGVADLFDEAFDLYKSNFKLFLAAACLILAPLHLLKITVIDPALMRMLNMQTSADMLDLDRIFDAIGQSIALFAVSLPISLLFYTILGGALVYMVGQRYLNRPVTLLGGFAAAMRRILVLASAVFIAVLIVAVTGAITFFLLGAAGAAMLCFYACLPQAIMFEPMRSPFAALSRSWKMCAPHFWRIAGVTSLLAIVVTVFYAAIEGGFAFFIQLIPTSDIPGLSFLESHASLLDGIADGLTDLLVAPFTFCLLTVMYFDIRIRDEGYDMAILAEQLGFATSATGSVATLPHVGGPTPPRKPKFWQKRPRGAAT